MERIPDSKLHSHQTIPKTNEISAETQQVLDDLRDISREYDKLNRNVQDKIAKAFQENKDKTFRDIHNAQLEIRLSNENLKQLYTSIRRFDAHFSDLDRDCIQVEKLFEYNGGLFQNTLLDIAIHTLGDCHHMSCDLRLRELMIWYEKIVILPLARLYMKNDELFSYFGRITLSEENLEMEFWNRFGDERPIGRGAYQTFGSLLRNGYFLTVLKVLQHRITCKAFRIPEVFLGNVVGWMYQARSPEDEQILFAIAHSLSEQGDYRPSPGVMKTFARLEKNLATLCPLDRIEDWNLLPCDNLLEEYPPPTAVEKEWRASIFAQLKTMYPSFRP